MFLAGSGGLAEIAAQAAIPDSASAVQASERAGAGAEAEIEPAIMPLRARDSLALTTIHEGLRRSETIRQVRLALVDADVVVYVATSSRDCRTRPKTTLFAAAEHIRYLSITLPVTSCSPRSSSERLLGLPEMIAWLGHELHHAREIAAAASVRDQGSVRRLFLRIGYWSAEFNGYETPAAIETQRAVLRELSDAEPKNGPRKPIRH